MFTEELATGEVRHVSIKGIKPSNQKVTYIKSAMHVDLAVYLVIAGKLFNSGHINALFDFDY